MTKQVQRTPTLEPLRSGRSAATLRLQLIMEAQQRHEIGLRIKELRNASPQTNRSIADYVGVGERAVAMWIAGGGIAWGNALKVAELFEVDVQWLWSGRQKGAVPDPFTSPQLDRIEANLTRLLVAAGLEPAGRSQEVATRLSEEAGDVLPTADEQGQREPDERESGRGGR